ncbi:vacuolar import and degradation protein, putative, partial [Ichthyophthirius multifiliis]
HKIKMDILKQFFGKIPNTQISLPFYIKDFELQKVSLYRQEENQEILIFDEATLQFTSDEKQEFQFFIKIFGNKEELYFPLDYQLDFREQENKNKIVFFITLKQRIQMKFCLDQQFQKQFNQFKDCLSKLIFIEEHKKLPTQDDQEYINSLPIIKTIENQVFEPNRILIQNEDKKFILLNPLEQQKAYYFDIETGKTTQEFTCKENTLKDICNYAKHSDLTNNELFYCLNDKNLFLMDPRKSNGIALSDIVEKEKIYSKNNKLTCIQSNVNGNFAVGGNDGCIRLYKEVGQKAKNLLPGFG